MSTNFVPNLTRVHFRGEGSVLLYCSLYCSLVSSRNLDLLARRNLPKVLAYETHERKLAIGLWGLGAY